MSLTKNEIAVIKKAADILDGWLKNLVRNNFGDMGCSIPLHAWYETYIIKAVDILIQETSQLGKSIKKECDDLLEKAEELSAMERQDDPDFDRKQAKLSLLARRIIPRFRRFAELIPSDAETTGKRGRIPKYTVEKLKEVQASFNKHHNKGLDIKAAWNKAAEENGISSGKNPGKAAQMACRRYLKQNK